MQITIRGMTPELEQEIQRLARQEGISLNKAALRIMVRGANLDRPGECGIGNSLDHLFGTWSQAEAKAFLRSVGPCARIDKDFWK